MYALPRAPDTFMFVKIDIAANEMIPPFDFIDRTAMVLFTAGSIHVKENDAPGDTFEVPRMIALDWAHPLKLKLGEILSQLGGTNDGFASHHSQSHLGNLAITLGDDRLTRENWWTDDEILARAKDPGDALDNPKKPADKPALDGTKKTANKPAKKTAKKAARKRAKEEL